MPESGPTEKFIQNYGTRVHHMAFRTENIGVTVETLKKDGMAFLLDLVGSESEGLRQIFSEPFAKNPDRERIYPALWGL